MPLAHLNWAKPLLASVQWEPRCYQASPSAPAPCVESPVNSRSLHRLMSWGAPQSHLGLRNVLALHIPRGPAQGWPGRDWFYWHGAEQGSGHTGSSWPRDWPVLPWPSLAASVHLFVWLLQDVFLPHFPIPTRPSGPPLQHSRRGDLPWHNTTGLRSNGLVTVGVSCPQPRLSTSRHLPSLVIAVFV